MVLLQVTCHILKNAIKKAVDCQTYPSNRDMWMHKTGTIAGQHDILNNAIDQAVDSHT